MNELWNEESEVKLAKKIFWHGINQLDKKAMRVQAKVWGNLWQSKFPNRSERAVAMRIMLQWSHWNQETWTNKTSPADYGFSPSLQACMARAHRLHLERKHDSFMS